MLRCGLLGQRLGHSYSPRIHSLLGDYAYTLYPTEPEDLDAFLKSGGFDGLNVTIPYKEAVLPYCRELSPRAAAIGSVNTLVRQPDGSLWGDNTDALGFSAMLHRLGAHPRNKKALVLGSGGASKAVCHVLREAGVQEIIIVSRQGQHTYASLHRHRDAELIVNTTPLGMYPDNQSAPLSLRDFPACTGVLDLIYNPARTPLLMEAETLGIPSLGGLTMLVGQAAAASALFTGQPISPQKELQVLGQVRLMMENIILIGMPGSGKTTVGQLLAQRLDRPFVDADQVLEAAYGPIPELFSREGESGFREKESQILRELGGRSGLVLATGGGCVTREQNYPSLHQNGTIVLLQRDIDTLDTQGRPLSLGADLSAMHRQRLPLYTRFADLTADNNRPPADTAKHIWEVLHEAYCH